MTTMTDTYEPEVLVIGQLAPECVLSVRMPRARFLELVEQTLDLPGYEHCRDELAAELLPVARTMPRFPLGTWLHVRRGCGCVVGEYLVAHVGLERADLLEELASDLDERPGGERLTTAGTYQVEALLEDHPLCEELMEFGGEIDAALVCEIRDGVPGVGVKPTEVRSIEFTD